MANEGLINGSKETQAAFPLSFYKTPSTTTAAEAHVTGDTGEDIMVWQADIQILSCSMELNV